MNFALLHLNNFTCPRKIISAFAVDLDGGKGRRGLHYRTGEEGQQSFDFGLRGAKVGALGDFALKIIGVGFSTPSCGKAINFAAIHGPLHRLSRLAQGDGQEARG